MFSHSLGHTSYDLIHAFTIMYVLGSFCTIDGVNNLIIKLN